MKARKIARGRPVVLVRDRKRRISARTKREDLLGKSALEAPVPGSLLVLLSRLYRAEPQSAKADEPQG